LPKRKRERDDGEERTVREVALEFLSRFAAADVDGLAALLAEDLEVEGPYLHVLSRADYLEALRRDPPVPSEVSVVDVREVAAEVTLTYEYRKPGGTIEVVQGFRVADGLVQAVRLDFATPEERSS